MALGILVMMFVGVSVISIAGLFGLFLLKNQNAKKVIFYLLSVGGIALSVFSCCSLPFNWVFQRMMAMGPGVLCIVGLVVHLRARSEKGKMAAYLILAVALAANILGFLL